MIPITSIAKMEKIGGTKGVTVWSGGVNISVDAIRRIMDRYDDSNEAFLLFNSSTRSRAVIYMMIFMWTGSLSSFVKTSEDTTLVFIQNQRLFN